MSSNNPKPMFQLRIRKFRHYPETAYPLYLGINKLGRNPHVSDIWLPMPFIDGHHCTIKCAPDGMIFVKDEPKREDQQVSCIKNSTVRGAGTLLEPDTFYELGTGRRLMLSGLVTCLPEKLSPEFNFRKGHIRPDVLEARKNNLYLAPTLGKVVTQRDYPEFDPDGNASQAESTQDESIPCTLSIAGLTMSLEDANPEGDITDGDVSFPAINSPLRNPRLLPSELTSRPAHDRSTDMNAPTLPYGELFPGFEEKPDQDSVTDAQTQPVESWARSPTRLPTRLADTHRSTVGTSSVHSRNQRPQTSVYDRDAPTQVVNDMPTQLFFDLDVPTQVLDNPTIQLLPDSDAPTPPAHINLTTPTYDRDAPTQFADNAPTQFSIDPDAPTQPVSNSMPTQVYDPTDVVTATQSTVQNDPSQCDENGQSNSESREAPTEAYDPNAPTQLVTIDQLSLPVDPEVPSQQLDVNQPTHSSSLSSILGPSSLEQNMTTADVVESTQPLENASSLEHNAAAADVVESTQPLANQGSSLDQEDPLSGSVEVPDSLPDIVKSTQPTQTKPSASTSSAQHSRHGSVEPFSQEASQVYPATASERRLHPVRIPSTPLADINQSQSSPPHQSATEGPMDEDEENDIVEATQMPMHLTPPDYAPDDIARDSSPDIIMGDRYSNSSGAGSPKHSLDDNSEDEDPQKPSKQIKRETTEEPLSSLLGRVSGRGSLQRRATMDLDTCKVLLSAPQMSAEDKAHNSTVVARLGGVMAEDCKKGSVLVLESSSRTVKFMCAIVLGIPIVSVEWIRASEEQGRFVSTEDHLFCDKVMEDHYGFKLEDTCRMARENRANRIDLFEGDTFYYITVATKPNDSPPDGFISKAYAKINLTPLVEVCGGKVAFRAPKQPLPEESKYRLFIVGPDKYCKETQEYIQRGFTVVRKEFILSTILKQRVEIQPHLIEESSESSEETSDVLVEDEDSNFEEDDPDAATGTSKAAKGNTSSSKSKGKAPQRPSRSSRAGSTVSNEAPTDDMDTLSSAARVTGVSKTGRSGRSSSTSSSSSKAKTGGSFAEVPAATIPSLRRSQSTKGSAIGKGRSRSRGSTIEAVDETDTLEQESGSEAGVSSRATATSGGKRSLTKSASTVHPKPRQVVAKPTRASSTVSASAGQGRSRSSSSSSSSTKQKSGRT